MQKDKYNEDLFITMQILNLNDCYNYSFSQSKLEGSAKFFFILLVFTKFLQFLLLFKKPNLPNGFKIEVSFEQKDVHDFVLLDRLLKLSLAKFAETQLFSKNPVLKP